MITVHIPNNFIPERTYAVRTLLTHYGGVAVDIIPLDSASTYTLSWEDKSITIADHFFGKIPDGLGYAHIGNVPKKIISSTTVGLENILILYGDDQVEIAQDRISSQVDLFAGAFFMLTRWEESLGLYKDLHQRYPASEALVVKEGFMLRPIVDEYVLLLRHWLSALGYSVPQDTSTYKLVATCDVDIPFYWRSKPLWKNLGGRLRKHWNPIKTMRDYAEFKATRSNVEKDPYDTFDYLMDLAEQAGNRFQFYILCGGKTKFEGHFKLSDPQIKTLLHEMISRGHQIGIHPSYNAYLDVGMTKTEKKSLEDIVKSSVTTSRQHYLRFYLPDTWRILSEAGITEDSTLGYAAEPGFRCGTCKPYPVFDIHRREVLPLIERPLLIMDVSLRIYKALDIDESIALCEEIKAQVKKHNGELVILWHNSSLSAIDGWIGWKKVIEKLFD